tara:strand:+ start:297 stop:1736 length:1440 start_codon:yes stop_codon:yes gene_type:complete
MANINHISNQNGCINTLTQHTSGLPYLQKTTCGTTNVVYNAYSWDANGNLTQWDDRQSNTYDLRLTYDQLDRVDNYRNFSNTLLGDMNYDPMGNITKFDSVVGSAIHYTYNSSNKRLISVSGYKNYAFSYDERGNIVDNGRDTLTYNLAGQVTSIGGYDYVYDAHNRRVKTIDTQGVRYSMYTLSGKLIHERINGANRENYYLGSQLVAHQGAGEKKYIHPDVLGGTAATTNAAKSPERTRYAPYGSAWGHTPKNEIGYTGHKQDSDTGLVYMQARYYDPVIGRFYSNDPIGFRDVHTFNRYAYANNNPYKYVDPDGRDVVFAVDPNGAGGNGHTTMYFQDGKGNWSAYNQYSTGLNANGGQMGNSDFLLGKDSAASVTIDPVSADSVPTDGLRVTLTADQDSMVAKSANESMNAHNSGDTKYNLYSNNCTDAAVDTFNSAGTGVKISNPATTVKPNSWIKDAGVVKPVDPDKIAPNIH